MSTETGIAVYSIRRDAAGTAAFTQEPEAQQAQQTSGMPRPSSFARHPDAEVTIY